MRLAAGRRTVGDRSRKGSKMMKNHENLTFDQVLSPTPGRPAANRRIICRQPRETSAPRVYKTSRIIQIDSRSAENHCIANRSRRAPPRGLQIGPWGLVGTLRSWPDPSASCGPAAGPRRPSSDAHGAATSPTLPLVCRMVRGSSGAVLGPPGGRWGEIDQKDIFFKITNI